MKDKKYVFFDLDGTITDSGLGITKSVQYALRAFGIEETNLKKLEPFIGPPLKDSFMEFYHMDEEQANKAVKAYREYYEVTGLFENEVYDGIPNVLKQLKEAGKEMVLATSKPEVFAKKILEHFQLDSYFSIIAGADLEGNRVEKLDVMKYAIGLANSEDYTQIVMIGDRKYDI
ncbi:MAG: HAD hydrolase-like protein, partial [Firmicutes bacterium]|nr:HAD hydrolase-like protein [Candidatus Scybalomonas excrementavium]